MRLLRAVVDRDAPLAVHSRQLGLPASTTHRLAAALAAHGLLVRTGRGRFRAGLGLIDLAGRVAPGRLLAEVARAPLRVLARTLGTTVHLGILEGDMVTYLVKEPRTSRVLTREGEQLEAYCSAIGKVMLASLSEAEQARYLGTAPFIALTDATLTTPAELASCLAAVGAEGVAYDDGEVDPGLFCVAVPVRRRGGQIVGALSQSGSTRERSQASLDAMHATADGIGLALG